MDSESIRDDRELCAHFKGLLKNRWPEEARHAKLDTGMIESLAEALKRR